MVDRAEWPLLDVSVAVEQMGCAVAPAAAVKAVVNDAYDSPTIENLAPYQWPWRRLVCGGAGGAGGGGGTIRWRMGGGGGEGDSGGGSDDPTPTLGGGGGSYLESVRSALQELSSEFDSPDPAVLDQEELPQYVQMVRGREGRYYEGQVPARRVTVFDLDR